MNHDVPQPVTATRSPGEGSSPERLGILCAASRQHAGCDEISASVLLRSAAPPCSDRSTCSPTCAPPVAMAVLMCQVAARLRHHVPASPVAATDLTKYRCAKKKKTISGARLMMLPAISSVHSVECAPWNVDSPSGSVI